MGERADRTAHRFLLVSMWISATVIAAVITWAAVARLGQQATASGQTTLTQSEVRRELSQAVSPPPTTSGGPTATPPASTHTTPSQHSTSPQQRTRRYRSWDVPGGRLGASCRGLSIHLDTATPLDGWRMQVDDSGPDKVSVEFSRGDSDSTVEASCSGGIPVLKSDS